MKIIHIVWGLSMGGVETMLVNIANEQTKLGHDVHIIVINNIYDESLISLIDKRIKMHFLERKKGSKSILPIIALNFLLVVLNPDIIHSHTASICKLLLPIFKKKLCITIHDIISTVSCNLKNAKRIFAISDCVKDDIYNKLNIQAITINNGVKIESIKSKTNYTNTKNFKIVQISRLMHEKKGQHILIKALSILYKKGYTNIQLDFIGEGDSLTFLEKLAFDLNLNNHVNFLGCKSQQFVFDHLCDYDLLVQPSIFEGFGLTVAEAMAAKVPVLVSQNQGPLEIIDNGKYGYYFSNGDADSCSRMIEQIISSGTDMSMIESAYKHVLEYYNIKITAKNYIDAYKSMI